jgi:hypothetical protein
MSIETTERAWHCDGKSKHKNINETVRIGSQLMAKTYQFPVNCYGPDSPRAASTASLLAASE